MRRWLAFALLAALAAAGCSGARQAQAPPSAKRDYAGAPLITEPPVPPIPPVSVRTTHLSHGVVAQDVRALARLMAAHPGDGTVRGPDQLVYDIDLTLDPQQHAFGAHLEVHLHNNLAAPIPVLYFNAWPDAYHFRRSGGYEKISDVQVDGQSARFSLRGTVLRVYPRQAVAPGRSVIVAMDLRALLPETADRYGSTGSQVALGNWFPMPAVHDGLGWVTPPYYADGESFYSLTGAFNLHVTAPKGYVYAATGDAVRSAQNPDGSVTTLYRAIGVRDVALVGNSAYQELQGAVDGVRLEVYTEPEDRSVAQSDLATGLSAMHLYDRLYGPYPFDDVKICLVRGWFGGMEYPRLVMVVPQRPGPGGDWNALVVSHELAHQWFFSLVGDDEYLTPWLDEAFATFSQQRFSNTPAMGPSNPAAVPQDVTDPVSAFPDSDFADAGHTPNTYPAAVYEDGAYALQEILSLMGETAFDRMMRRYVRRYAYRVATSGDFARALRQALGKPVGTYLRNLRIVPQDDVRAPQLLWARMEERENGRGWR